MFGRTFRDLALLWFCASRQSSQCMWLFLERVRFPRSIFAHRSLTRNSTDKQYWGSRPPGQLRSQSGTSTHAALTSHDSSTQFKCDGTAPRTLMRRAKKPRWNSKNKPCMVSRKQDAFRSLCCQVQSSIKEPKAWIHWLIHQSGLSKYSAPVMAAPIYDYARKARSRIQAWLYLKVCRWVYW